MNPGLSPSEAETLLAFWTPPSSHLGPVLFTSLVGHEDAPVVPTALCFTGAVVLIPGSRTGTQMRRKRHYMWIQGAVGVCTRLFCLYQTILSV